MTTLNWSSSGLSRGSAWPPGRVSLILARASAVAGGGPLPITCSRILANSPATHDEPAADEGNPISSNPARTEDEKAR
jgi:hypothetical protein